MYGHDRQKDFFWGALVGGAIATLTSLLFTTKKGKQIQRQISDSYEEFEDSLKDAFTDAKETYHHAKEKAEDSVDHAGKKVAHAAHKVKEDKDSK